MFAPFQTEMAFVASVPFNLSFVGASFKIFPIKDFREVPTNIGNSENSLQSLSSFAISSKFCSKVLLKPMPTSRQICSSFTPKLFAFSILQLNPSETSCQNIFNRLLIMHRFKISAQMHQN